MPRIVVITHQNDAHIPFVEPYLSSKLQVIDPYQILDKEELSYIFDGRQCTTSYRNRLVRHVKSVWYRKPSRRQDDPLPVEKELEHYARSAVTNHVEMLRSQFPDARWISDFYAINKARNKAWQLHLAARMGFAVPEAIITSDEKRAREFMKKYAPTIVKSQAISFPAINKKTYFFFAKRINVAEEINLANLHLAPAIFQRAIDVIADIRVTVVGTQVFAAIIKNSADDTAAQAVRDWRFEHSAGRATFENYDSDLPQSIRTLSVELTQNMGLAYGAIDLVMDKAGKLWFLEINPNGQWAFIEEETKQPIGKALAALLEAGAER